MSFRVELVPEARAEARALPAAHREQLVELLAALGAEPRPRRARELLAHPPILRIWLASRWRVAFHVEQERRRVVVLCVREKADVLYDTLPSWATESEELVQIAAQAAGEG